MKGICSTQAMLAVCAVLLLAGCGGGKSIGDGEVAAADASTVDQSRAFDTGLPELPPVIGKDVIDVSTETVELSADDSYDTSDVCIHDREGIECAVSGKDSLATTDDATKMGRGRNRTTRCQFELCTR
jgi:hypothetical protein